jgi:hypothetical protein
LLGTAQGSPADPPPQGQVHHGLPDPPDRPPPQHLRRSSAGARGFSGVSGFRGAVSRAAALADPRDDRIRHSLPQPRPHRLRDRRSHRRAPHPGACCYQPSCVGPVCLATCPSSRNTDSPRRSRPRRRSLPSRSWPPSRHRSRGPRPAPARPALHPAAPGAAGPQAGDGGRAPRPRPHRRHRAAPGAEPPRRRGCPLVPARGGRLTSCAAAADGWTPLGTHTCCAGPTSGQQTRRPVQDPLTLGRWRLNEGIGIHPPKDDTIAKLEAGGDLVRIVCALTYALARATQAVSGRLGGGSTAQSARTSRRTAPVKPAPVGRRLGQVRVGQWWSNHPRKPSGTVPGFSGNGP